MDLIFHNLDQIKKIIEKKFLILEISQINGIKICLEDEDEGIPLFYEIRTGKNDICLFSTFPSNLSDDVRDIFVKKSRDICTEIVNLLKKDIPIRYFENHSLVEV